VPAMKALQLCNRSPNVAGAARSSYLMVEALVPTGSVGMQSRRAAPRITINVWRIRDAARPALHSHAARGNEKEKYFVFFVPFVDIKSRPYNCCPALRCRRSNVARC